MTFSPSLPALALLGLAALTGPALRAETYAIDSANSSVGFTTRLVGRPVPGKFSAFSGKITFDPAHPETMTAEARIEADSISTNNERRDHHLRTPDYFDAARYPELVFQGRSVQPGAGGDFDLTGDLTIKATTKSVVLHVHPTAAAGDPPRWEAKTTINRKDFGVAHDAISDRVIGDTVEITLEIQGKLL
jgi:polyisoprenoid-binding protein YceI